MAEPATSAIRMTIELFRSLSGGPIEIDRRHERVGIDRADQHLQRLTMALQHSEQVFIECRRRGGAQNPSYNSYHPNHPHIGSRIARMYAEWPSGAYALWLIC